MSDADMAVRARALAEMFDRSFASPARVHEDQGRPALAVRIGGDRYVLPVHGLSSLSRRRRIVPLLGGSVAQLGLSGIDGALVGVFSLPALLGYDVALSRIAWVAVARVEMPIGLAFEDLDGQVTVPEAIAAAPPDARRHVAGLVRVDGEDSARGLLDLGSLLARLARPGGARGA